MRFKKSTMHCPYIIDFFLILEEMHVSFWCAILKYLPNDWKESELDKAVVHVISLISYLWLWFSFCLPSDMEKEMATHSCVLAWRIPGTGEPGGLQSLGSHRVGHDWSDLAAAAAALWYKDKRLMGASWWGKLGLVLMGETGSCSDGLGHAQ